MTGLALLIQVCAAGVCWSDELPIQEVSLYGCMGPQGQKLIAEYEAAHPSRRVVKWRCGQSDRLTTARI